MDGDELILAGVIQGQSFNITGLTACMTYTVSVELSYAYTFEKDKMSIEVNIKCPGMPLNVLIVICVVVILILVILVVIAVVLIIFCILKLRGKNDNKLQSLKNDENEPKEKKVRSNRDFEYAQILPPIDKLAHNPVLTKPSPKFNQSAVSKAHYDNVQLSRINPRDKEYTELSSNPDYMTIDETTMIPLDTDMERREYANLSDEPTSIVPQSKQTIKSQNKEYIPLSDIEYTPMSAIRISPEAIPVNEFATKYQMYVDSGIMQGSIFWMEYDILNEECEKNVDPVSKEAMTDKNALKNPIKNILPFDENRVVLHSLHFDCNYINASYINDYQFIASIHPIKETHRDFLQMIYQTEASMVIMLTTRKEKAKMIGGVSNRVCYWPKKDEPINCEPFVSTLINSTETNAFIKQEISLENTQGGKKHSFTQVISPVWNEDSTITDVSYVVNLLNRIQKQFQDNPSKSIIIHCEDGISKTGIILTAMNCVREMTLKKTINIFNAVKNLRKQRMKMVPTLVSI